MAEVASADRNGNGLAFSCFQGDTLESFEFFQRTLNVGFRPRDIYLSHFLSVDGRRVGKCETDIVSIGSRYCLQVTVLECGIRKTETKGVGGCNSFAVIPAVANKIILGVIGNQFLSAIVASVVHEANEDVTLIVGLNDLRIGTGGIGRYVFEALWPRHRQSARGRYFARQHFGEGLSPHRTVKP